MVIYDQNSCISKTIRFENIQELLRFSKIYANDAFTQFLRITSSIAQSVQLDPIFQFHA